MTEAAPAPAPATPIGPVPTIGRIVHYRLSDHDAARINERRVAAHEMKSTIYQAGGLQHCTGNRAEAGQRCPMMIVAVWGDRPDSLVNGQVFLDGWDIHWATSVGCGAGPGTWSWPPRG